MRTPLKSVSTLLFTAFSGLFAAADIPVEVLSSKNYAPLAGEEQQIINVIKSVYDTKDDSSPFCKINVHVITDEHLKPQYLIAYLLGAKELYYERARIDLDSQFGVRSVQNDYDVTKKERSILYEEREGKCPDHSVVFFGVTPIGFMPSCYEAVLHVDLFAQQRGIKCVKILDAKLASNQVYKDWLSCPNLKGFFTVTHGNQKGIACGKGDIEFDYFDSLPKDYLKGKVLYFNACLVHNDPFLTSIVNKGVQRFIGGIPTLKIGPSEQVAKYFWSAAFDKKPMTPALKEGEKKFYPNQGAHGMSGTGSDIWGQE